MPMCLSIEYNILRFYTHFVPSPLQVSPLLWHFHFVRATFRFHLVSVLEYLCLYSYVNVVVIIDVLVLE